MDKYTQRSMVMPRTTKVNLTLFMFNIIDLIIVFASLMIGIRVASALPINVVFQILIALLSVVIGIFSASRAKTNPGIRNWKNVIWAFAEDRSKYYPINLEPRKGEKRNEI